jgi:hypothetical protein
LEYDASVSPPPTVASTGGSVATRVLFASEAACLSARLSASDADGGADLSTATAAMVSLLPACSANGLAGGVGRGSGWGLRLPNAACFYGVRLSTLVSARLRQGQVKDDKRMKMKIEKRLRTASKSLHGGPDADPVDRPVRWARLRGWPFGPCQLGDHFPTLYQCGGWPITPRRLGGCAPIPRWLGGSPPDLR